MNANFVLAWVTIVISVFFYIYSKTLPSPGGAEKIGAAGWPSAILILMFVLGVWLLVRTTLEKKKRKAGTKANVESSSSEEEKGVTSRLSKNHFIITAVLVVYVTAVPILGFLIATFLLVITLTWLLGMKRKRNIAITSVVSSTFFIYMFTIVLQLPLPRGWGLFREISLLFY